MPTIKLLKRAELELIDACDWYEKQLEGLSLKFRNEIRSSLYFISNNPNLYAAKYNTELHFAPVKIFPFIIVYWYDENIDIIFVTSIFHTKRNPVKFDPEF